MLAEYVRRHIPEPVVCLGVRLRPYCIGHDLLLYNFHSPLVANKKNKKGESLAPELGDLLLGLYICSQTYEDAYRNIAEGKHIRWARDFRKQFHRKPFKPLEEYDFLSRYIAEAIRQPRVYFTEAEGDNTAGPGAAFQAVLKVFLMERLHLSPSEALNYPIAVAWYEYSVWLEIRGGARIESAEDAERKAAIEAYRKEHPEFA